MKIISYALQNKFEPRSCHHPIRPLAWVKTIYVKKCCVEVSCILSNGVNEETHKTKLKQKSLPPGTCVPEQGI